jgi:hypothetical protein
METRKYLFETLWRNFLAESAADAVTLTVRGPVQNDVMYAGEEDQISYHIYSALKKLNGATQITSEADTYADYEMQGYTNVNQVKDVLEKGILTIFPNARCDVDGLHIECTLNVNESLNEQVGTEYDFYTDGMKSETHTYKITKIEDSEKKQRDPANPRNITGTIPTKRITLQWTNPPQGLPPETIVITKECGNKTIKSPRGYKLDDKFITYLNTLC